MPPIRSNRTPDYTEVSCIIFYSNADTLWRICIIQVMAQSQARSSLSMEQCLRKTYRSSHLTSSLRSLKKKERKHRSIVQERISASTTMCYQESYRTGQQSEKACVKWLVCIICTENAVRIWKVDIPFIVPTYDIQIDDSLGFTLIVHGWFLPEDHIIYKNNEA